ncbi:MAG TPA: tetratricopeptide repeat protein [Polyangia bacterium]|jgi:uncharacterized protein (AIM24 family)
MQPSTSHLASAGELVAAKRFGEAEGEILRALSDAPKNVQALNLLALVRYKLGRLEDAHATYREIAGASPQDARARRNLGLIALKLGRVDEALPELEMAVRLTPGDERAWSYLGYAYAKKGEVVEAAAAFRRAGQDALALELEHAATVRRPPTPSLRYPMVAPGDGEPGTLVEGRAGTPPLPSPPAPPAPRRATTVGAHALAPPLPPPLEDAASRLGIGTIDAPGEVVAEAARAIEATPVPLLAFVLSRLGQAPAPAIPSGALRLSIVDEAHVRADGVLAGAGNLTWAPAFRRSQGRHTTERLGPEGGRFFRLTGAGDVWIAGAPTRWLPVSLTEDVLYVREDRVLAFDGTLSWETGTVPGADLRMLQFRGRGVVALSLGDAPVAIKVTEDRPTLLAGARLVGWVGRLVPHGAPVSRTTTGGTATDPAPFQIVCQGEGVVLLDTPKG